MAEFLFSPRSYYWVHIPQERLPSKIRLSIFLIAELFVGVPALVWALRVLYGRYKSGGRISNLVFMLLLSDLLVLLLSLYVVTKLLQDDGCWKTSMTCYKFTSVWSTSMIYGLYLHQVMALEAALFLRHPPRAARAFFSDGFIKASITVFTFVYLCELFEVTHLLLLSLPLLLIIMLTACIVNCRAPPQTSDPPSRTRKQSSAVLAFATCSLILCVTFIMLCIIMGGPWSLWVMYYCLMSLRVVLDPVLCVLVYRKDLKLNTPPTHAEHDAVIELTEIQSSNSHTAQEV